MNRLKLISSWSSILTRLIMLSVLWWVLSVGDSSSWWIGLPAVLIALGVSMYLQPVQSVNWIALLRFIPFFVWQSLVGGLDVARRALHLALPITPDLVEYPVTLPNEFARVIFIYMISLIPGSLCVAMHRDTLSIHILDIHSDFLAEIGILEQKISTIFCNPQQPFSAV